MALLHRSFGEMHYNMGWWRNRILFKPTSEEIDVYVAADPSLGPSNCQSGAFDKLESQYQEMKPTLFDSLYREYLRIHEMKPWSEAPLKSFPLFSEAVRLIIVWFPDPKLATARLTFFVGDESVPSIDMYGFDVIWDGAHVRSVHGGGHMIIRD